MAKQYIHVSDGAYDLAKIMAIEEEMHLKYFISKLIVREAMRGVSGIVDNELFKERSELIKEVKKEVEKEEQRSLNNRRKNSKKAAQALSRMAKERKQREKDEIRNQRKNS